MVATNSFTHQQAPCGRIVDGETYEDRDDETVLTQEVDYACGCRTIRHEYHDGSVSQTVIRHDGTVLVDEMLSAE
jgi:membrane-bound inhibitor of C-type lysozyme